MAVLIVICKVSHLKTKKQTCGFVLSVILRIFASEVAAKIHIMGIVNLTPDSFYAGSRVNSADAISRIQQLFAEGADVVDLGACSTRPGADIPPLEEEWRRLEPVLEAIGKGIPLSGAFARTGSRSDAEERGIPFSAISIDTFRSEIVRRAYDLIGPFMVNDVSGGQWDAEMLQTVGRLELPYVAMHTEKAMHGALVEGDVVDAVNAYFSDFAVKAADAGIRDWILDPGFGFSKSMEQNWELLQRLPEVSSRHHRPVLVGLSRKSMVYKALGITPEEAMPATQIVQFKALEGGATWLRTHDVAASVQTAGLYSTMYTSSPGAAK